MALTKKYRKNNIVKNRIRELVNTLEEIKEMLSSVFSGMKQLLSVLEENDKND